MNKTSNLYDLEFRNYDPLLGRMTGVDPMASKYASLTPYNYSFNNPVTFSDQSGADPFDNWNGPTGGYDDGADLANNLRSQLVGIYAMCQLIK